MALGRPDKLVRQYRDLLGVAEHDTGGALIRWHQFHADRGGLAALSYADLRAHWNWFQRLKGIVRSNEISGEEQALLDEAEESLKRHLEERDKKLAPFRRSAEAAILAFGNERQLLADMHGLSARQQQAAPEAVSSELAGILHRAHHAAHQGGPSGETARKIVETARSILNSLDLNYFEAVDEARMYCNLLESRLYAAGGNTKEVQTILDEVLAVGEDNGPFEIEARRNLAHAVAVQSISCPGSVTDDDMRTALDRLLESFAKADSKAGRVFVIGGLRDYCLYLSCRQEIDAETLGVAQNAVDRITSMLEIGEPRGLVHLARATRDLVHLECRLMQKSSAIDIDPIYGYLDALRNIAVTLDNDKSVAIEPVVAGNTALDILVNDLEVDAAERLFRYISEIAEPFQGEVQFDHLIAHSLYLVHYRRCVEDFQEGKISREVKDYLSVLGRLVAPYNDDKRLAAWLFSAIRNSQRVAAKFQAAHPSGPGPKLVSDPLPHYKT